MGSHVVPLPLEVTGTIRVQPVEVACQKKGSFYCIFLKYFTYCSGSISKFVAREYKTQLFCGGIAPYDASQYDLRRFYFLFHASGAPGKSMLCITLKTC